MALFEDAASLFKHIVTLLPWRQESDLKEALDAIDEHVAPVFKVPSGVQVAAAQESHSVSGDEKSFPTTVTE